MASVALSTKAVGSTVKLKVNGTAREFLVVHQGKPSSLYDESCNGTWLLMKDCYESRQWHSSNSNSYKASTIHTYLNGTFLNLFDADIREVIKQVKIPYVNGTGNSAVASGSSGLSCKIFLLSGREVGFSTSDNQYFPNDGAKLSYFESGTGSSALNKRIAKLNGSATLWWLRSPYTDGTSYAWSSAPMAATTTAAAPARMASAPLWYFPLTSWSLLMGRFRRTRPRPSPAPAATAG